jgi:hypothetical protein
MLKNAVSKLPQRVMTQPGLSPEIAMLLTSPQSRYAPENALACGMDWAADNGFYSVSDFDALCRSLQRWQGIPRCKFIVLPDVWGNAKETMAYFDEWVSIYEQMGFPPALALQDGIENFDIQWERLAAVFVGGSDVFKESDTCFELVQHAKQLGLHAHSGRCNHPRRILQAVAWGFDSFDGQSFQREKHIVDMLPYQLCPKRVAEQIWREFGTSPSIEEGKPQQMRLAI